MKTENKLVEYSGWNNNYRMQESLKR